MVSGLDSGTSDLSDSLVDAQSQQNAAPTTNPNDYGALPPAKEKIDPSDVEQRKQIFNNAAQRIIAMRNAMQQPYGGMDLGKAGFVQGITNNLPAGSPLAGMGNALAGQATGAETQRKANLELMSQQQGMDTRASIAKILSSPTLGDEDKIKSMYQLSVLGGDEKGATSAAQMLRAMHSGVAGRAVSVINEQGKPEMVSAQDAVDRHLAPIARDPTTGAILNQTSGTGATPPIPPKVQQIWQDNNLATPTHVSKDEYKDNEAEYKKAVDAHDGALGAAKVAEQAEPALKNYWSGTYGKSAADMNAMLPDALQAEGAQNTQFLGKKSGEIAMQIANASKGMRIGVGMERFAKSTTLDPLNASAVNEKIVDNIKDLPLITQQQKDMEAYVKQFPAQQKEAIRDAFYNDYPMMTEQDKTGSKPAIINPAYKDPALFRKWLQNKDKAAPSAPTDNSGATPPQGAKQAKDGNYYLPDPNRPGKYLQWQP